MTDAAEVVMETFGDRALRPAVVLRCAADKCCSICAEEVLAAHDKDGSRTWTWKWGTSRDGSCDRLIWIEVAAGSEVIEALRAFHRHATPLGHRHERAWAQAVAAAELVAERAQERVEETRAAARAWLDTHP